MNVNIPKGKYVVAVSGGVDSIVLLDMLANAQDNNTYIVAHFDHGIRSDSGADAKLVGELAKNYSLNFVTKRAELGPGASEDLARQARYDFLRGVAKQQKTDKIITAHHQDDLLETILLHVQRGTGRAGLTPMQTADVLRPLLYTPKNDILKYALQQNLTWHNDITNNDMSYARNKIRAALAVADPNIKRQLLAAHKSMLPINVEIDALVGEVYDYSVQDNCIVRSRFVQLPFVVQTEVIYKWLKNNDIKNIQKSMVYAAVIACKTYAPHKKVSLNKHAELLSQQKLIKLLQK